MDGTLVGLSVIIQRDILINIFLFIFQGECYTYDCRVSYHCADGHRLQGKSERICLADGTWSPKDLPTCVQVS